MRGLGAIIGVISSVSGMYVSYYLNVPSGAGIVLVVTGLFVVALLFSPSHGILTRPEMGSRKSKILQHLKQLGR